MPLWNLTQEKVDELVEEQRVKTLEVEELHSTTDKQLWERDLDAFEEAMDASTPRTPSSPRSSGAAKRRQEKPD